MENSNATIRRWEDMELDILVKIFMSFDIYELTSGVSRVCSSWRLACCDPILWKTLDLGLLRSNFIKIPSPPYVWVDAPSDKRLMQLLKIALGLSRGSTTSLIFHFNLYLRDEHLIYAAERYFTTYGKRCPQLKRLVLPAWNRITKVRICDAVSKWENLESLTMPSIGTPGYIMEKIGACCKNFTQLKVMGPCDVSFATAIANHIPNLKVLSLRCSMLHKEALVIILEQLQQLEVLNISHCLLVEVPPLPASKKVFRELDLTIIEKSLRLKQFFTCQDDLCLLCQLTIADDGLLRWYKYEESLWRADEISSLAH
ncbi:hypothetical protein GIB67_040701 [Kingdonia uniflora]|uniref:F-box domain-containing protein n=1 Tax=Kingdonia uniflora TaxID=39325 RepID=A0A7J7KUD9_9MAGN|nr:hypothetical protein GIB67_040701 [Kingdonia uniflora]